MMPELTQRQKFILGAVVREHVKTARPIGSKEIVEGYRLPFSAATVRNEMCELTELGLLSQPHISAGRTPTDAGYRLFVDGMLNDREQIHRREQEMLDELFEKEVDDFLSSAARAVARLGGGFTVSGIPERNIFYKTGFSEILREPEFTDAEFAKDFGELADSIDEEIRELLADDDFEEPRVFIGGENPITGATNCSMIVSSFESPKRVESVLVVLGPKRMNYQKNIRVINYIHDYGK